MTKQENNRLVNIGYFGGSHGAFLKFFVDKFSKKTSDITSSPFLVNGTSHNTEVKYSGRVHRYTFEDTDGTVRNNYKLENKGEPQILITLDEESQMNFLRLHFTRKSDHELTSADFTKLDDGTLVSRSKDHALITDPERAKEHVYNMVKNQTLNCHSGKQIPCEIDSICIHGDNKSSLLTAIQVKENLLKNNLELKPLNKMSKFI